LTASRPFRRRVLVNTASTGLANVWAMVVTLVTLPVLLRGLGATAFGLWVLVQTFSAITGWLSLADLGMRVAATRAVAQRASLGDDAGVSQLVGTAAVLYATVGAVCAAALFVLGPRFLPGLFSASAPLRGDLRFAIRLFAAQVLLELLAAGLGACLEGLQRVDLARGSEALRRTLVAVVTATVAIQGGGLRGVAAASLVASAAGAVVTLIVLGRHLPAGSRRPSPTHAKALLGYGTTVGLLNATGVLHRTMDRLIVGAVLGSGAVALVEVATQVQNGAAAILAASSYATLSSAAWLRARDAHDTLRELFERGTRYSVLVTMPFVGLAALLAGPLVRLWIGPRFAGAAGLVTVAVLYIAMSAPLQVGSNLLQSVGRAGVVLRVAAVSVVVNFAASLILVHVTGIVGVFQGTLVGAAVLAVPLAAASLKEAGMQAHDFARGVLLPSLLPTLALCTAVSAVLAIRLGDVQTLVLGSAAGFGAYAVAAWRWSVQPGEVRDLVQSLRRTPGEAEGSS
jgi:O-antigen/teichoic acid export membrane protein